jgi:hypothetical protein
VAGGRVDITKIKKTDTELPNLSGGYFLEIDAYASGEAPEAWFNSQNPHSVPVTIKAPDLEEDFVQAQRDYIINHFNTMQTALFAANYQDPTVGFRKYIDVPSLLRHFLVGEISGNTDTYWSCYIYKERNNDKFYFGPVWDFDIAFENDTRTHWINNKTEFICVDGSSSHAGSTRDFVNRWLSDSILMDSLRATYTHYRDIGEISVDTLLNVVDNYAEMLGQSQDLNFKCWGSLNEYLHMNWGIQGSYQGEVNVVKNYLEARIDWLDNKLNYVPNPTSNYVLIKDETFKNVNFFSENNTLNITNLPKNTRILCYNLNGHFQFADKVSSEFTKNLTHGIYFVKLSDENGHSQTFKCIVK